MATTFGTDDLVWAKMKGFPAWPGKVSEPPENKRSSDKKPKIYIFFFGSENFAWVPCDMVWAYEENKDKYMTLSRPSHSFQEAVDAIEDYIKENGVVFKPTSDAKEENKQTDIVVLPIGDISSDPTSDTLSTAVDKTTPGSKRSAQTIQGSPVPLKTRILEKEGLLSSSAHNASSVVEVKDDPNPKKEDNSSSADATTSSVRAKRQTKKSIPSNVAESETCVAVAKTTKAKSTTTTTSESNRASKDKSEGAFLPDVLHTSMDSSSKDIVPTVSRIGFLGLGNIGVGIVENLLATGHSVTIWNRSSAKCKELYKKGAQKSSNPGSLVQSCDITFACVADPAAIKDLVFSPGGVLQGMSEGKGFVNLTTMDVETTIDISEVISARGGRYLEAPLMGSKILSKAGQLIVLTSGDQSLFEDCSSSFKAIAKTVLNLGELGSASKMQLVINALMGTTLAGLAESLALACKVGLDPQEVLEIIGHSSAGSVFFKEKGSDMINNRMMEPSCKLQTMQKDLRMAINMSEGVDQPLHVGSAVNELFKKAKAKGYGDADISAVYRAADL